MRRGVAVAFGIVVVAVAVVVALMVMRPSPQPSGLSFVDAGPVPVPEDGAYFGTHFSQRVDRQSLITELERDLGRSMAIDHVYHGWDTPFPSEYDRWTVSEGRMPFLSWSSRRDQQAPAKWADIATGRYDDLIEQRAREVAALGVPVLMSFDHEPMSQVGSGAWDSGSVEEFKAAFRHVTQVFDRAGADNVAWVWTLTAQQFRAGDPQGLYPGDDVVDWIGVDGYVNIGCPWLDVDWRAWTEVFSPAHEFALERGKPLVVAEFGLREDPDDPGRKGDWLASSVAEIQAMPALKAVVSFNSEADCSSYIVSSPEALDGYREMGADPWLAPKPSLASVPAAPASADGTK